jgi:hypothetical protein
MQYTWYKSFFSAKFNFISFLVPGQGCRSLLLIQGLDPLRLGILALFEKNWKLFYVDGENMYFYKLCLLIEFNFLRLFLSTLSVFAKL